MLLTELLARWSKFADLSEEACLPITATRQQALLQQVQDTSLLLQGLCDHTAMRGDEWHFLQLGRFLERGDNMRLFVAKIEQKP